MRVKESILTSQILKKTLKIANLDVMVGARPRKLHLRMFKERVFLSKCTRAKLKTQMNQIRMMIN